MESADTVKAANALMLVGLELILNAAVSEREVAWSNLGVKRFS